MSRNSVKGIMLDGKEEDIGRCKWCVDGKQTSLPMKERTIKATVPGEVIQNPTCVAPSQ